MFLQTNEINDKDIYEENMNKNKKLLKVVLLSLGLCWMQVYSAFGMTNTSEEERFLTQSSTGIRDDENVFGMTNEHWSPIKISCFGKISLPNNLKYVCPFDIGILETQTKNVYGIQSALLCAKSENLYGIQCSFGRNIIENKFMGIQISGFCSDNGSFSEKENQNSKILGVNVAGFYSRENDFSGIKTVGLFSRNYNFNGLQVSGGYSNSENFNGVQVSGLYTKSNIFYGLGISSLLNTKKFHGIGVGIFGNGAEEFFSGFQISSLFSVCGEYKFDYDFCFARGKNENIKISSGTFYGLQAGGLISKSENMYGIKLAGLVSDTNKEFRGISVGGLSSYSGSGLGLSVSIIYSANYYGKFYGLIASGILTYCENMKGLQVSFANTSNDITGFQIGGINYVSNNLTGAQMGIFNEAENIIGAQVGVFNYCKNLKGVQIGLLNYLDNSKIFGIKILPLINFAL
jgi:hypothetical protein